MRSASLAVAIFLLCFAGDLSRRAAADPGDRLSVLSYNIHGLFRLVAKDNPRDRMPTIGWLANRYDVVMFQEDFEFHDILVTQMERRVVYRGNGVGGDPRRLLLKVVLFPLALLVPHFSPPYGAGLSTFLAPHLGEPSEVTRRAFGICDGWLRNHGDCWANKGLLRTRVRMPSGAEVDVYNTHLDAGGAESGAETRRMQLERIAQEIERRSARRAVVIGGDFNLWFIRPPDRDVFLAFRKRVGALDSGAGPELPFWRERNFILYRSGDDVALTLESAGEATEFVSGQRALSDHPALYARFRVTRLP